MANLSNTAENMILNWLMTDDNVVTRPNAWYLALFTAAPSDAGGGTELSGNGYARQTIAFSVTSDGTTSNTDPVSFTAAGGNFGTVTHIGIFTDEVGGDLLWHGALAASKTVEDGDTLTFNTGAVDISID